MNFKYVDWRSHKNIQPIEFTNKNQYYSDLINIENSWSGRIDGNICNTFIMESEQLLINAIELFERGYFDCAFYSLRSAVELSTTMVFLDDMPEDEQKGFLEAWKDTLDFPMQGQMIRQLSQHGNVFRDMKNKMPEFFLEAKKLSAELNKYVHKQGLAHFYISRNHPLNKSESCEVFLQSFEQYLQRCIGVVAVMRLAIDPFPVLLMDEEILYRCFDSLTDAYSQKFVEKYIGKNTITRYKETEFFRNTYNSFLNEEKKNEATFNVMKHQYIDSQRMEEIFEQLHLLHKEDIISVMLVYSCDKIVKIYRGSGLWAYFTDKNTNRKAMSWSSEDFKRFSTAEELLNQAYDEAYITVLRLGEELYYIEHNELLEIEEVGQMVGSVTGALFKMGLIKENE